MYCHNLSTSVYSPVEREIRVTDHLHIWFVGMVFIHGTVVASSHPNHAKGSFLCPTTVAQLGSTICGTFHVSSIIWYWSGGPTTSQINIGLTANQCRYSYLGHQVMSVRGFSHRRTYTVYLPQPFGMRLFCLILGQTIGPTHPLLQLGDFFSLRERITCFFGHSKVVTKTHRQADRQKGRQTDTCRSITINLFQQSLVG